MYKNKVYTRPKQELGHKNSIERQVMNEWENDSRSGHRRHDRSMRGSNISQHSRQSIKSIQYNQSKMLQMHDPSVS